MRHCFEDVMNEKKMRHRYEYTELKIVPKN